MHLTLHTDYSLRVLMYLGSTRELSSIGRISRAYDISHHHVVKVVAGLVRLGHIETVRGREGGLGLARGPREICIGAVVRATEPLHLVECFDAERNTCPVTGGCALKAALAAAQEAFLRVLDGYTLADLLAHPQRMQQLLGISSPKRRPASQIRP